MLIPYPFLVSFSLSHHLVIRLKERVVSRHLHYFIVCFVVDRYVLPLRPTYCAARSVFLM